MTRVPSASVTARSRRRRGTSCTAPRSESPLPRRGPEPGACRRRDAEGYRGTLPVTGRGPVTPSSSRPHAAATAGSEAPRHGIIRVREAHARQFSTDQPHLPLAVRRRSPQEPRVQPVLGGPGGGPGGPAAAARRPGSRHHQRRLQRSRLRALGGERPRGGREPAAEPPARAEARRHPRPRLRGLLRACSAAAAPARAREIYAELRRALPEASREHWDREIRLFEPDRTRARSFYYGGTSGLVALAMRPGSATGRACGRRIERLLGARTLEEQLGDLPRARCATASSARVSCASWAARR